MKEKEVYDECPECGKQGKKVVFDGVNTDSEENESFLCEKPECKIRYFDRKEED